MWFDNLIGFFSPRASFKRLQYRAASKHLKRFYEGAASGRRTEGWKAHNTSANAEIKTALPTLRNRSRDLVRNNPYARRGINLISTNVVGKGIRANIKGASTLQSRKFNDLWAQWALTSEIDFDGKNNLYGLQALAMRTIAESGEVLIRRRYLPSDNLPMKIQVLEPDHLVSNTISYARPKGENGNQVHQGIEVDSQGQIVAYHLYKDHPGSFGSTSMMDTVRVPAEEMSHLYLVERAGQLRGVPWLAPVLIKLKDFDEYDDAQLVRQKIAACFTAFVQDIHPLEEPLTSPEGAPDTQLTDKFEPGIIEFLPPGKTISFATPPGVEGFSEYTAINLRAVATGLGVSYEALTGDLSQVNFSSARMGWLEFQRNIDIWREHLLNPMFNDKLFRWFLEATPLIGLNPNEVSCDWVSPRREMIDPTKEIPAKINAIRAGIESLEDAVFQQGKVPKDHFEQIRATNELLDSLGLVLDSDPRKDKNSTTDSANTDDSDESVEDDTEVDEAEQRMNGSAHYYHINLMDEGQDATKDSRDSESP